MKPNRNPDASERPLDLIVMSHLNCSLILPGRSLAGAKQQWLRERTHGCWCSSWRVVNGEYMIWRDERWQKPKPGELRRSKTHNIKV
jgi:hypothetical protein